MPKALSFRTHADVGTNGYNARKKKPACNTRGEPLLHPIPRATPSDTHSNASMLHAVRSFRPSLSPAETQHLEKKNAGAGSPMLPPGQKENRTKKQVRNSKNRVYCLTLSQHCSPTVLSMANLLRSPFTAHAESHPIPKKSYQTSHP